MWVSVLSDGKEIWHAKVTPLYLRLIVAASWKGTLYAQFIALETGAPQGDSNSQGSQGSHSSSLVKYLGAKTGKREREGR